KLPMNRHAIGYQAIRDPPASTQGLGREHASRSRGNRFAGSLPSGNRIGTGTASYDWRRPSRNFVRGETMRGERIKEEHRESVKPPPELEALDYFVGSWSCANHLEAGPDGPE